VIEKYDFGKIVIDGKEYRRDLIITLDGIRENWWRKEGHKLHFEDLSDVLSNEVEVLVIGTGYYGLMEVPEEVKRQIEEKGIKVVVEKTEDACKTFNKLLKEGKRVIAALHLTC